MIQQHWPAAVPGAEEREVRGGLERKAAALEKRREALDRALQAARAAAPMSGAEPAAPARDAARAERLWHGALALVNHSYTPLFRQWTLLPEDEALLRELLALRAVGQSGAAPARENWRREIDRLLHEHLGPEKFEALGAHEASLPLRTQLEQAAKLLRHSPEALRPDQIEEFVQLHRAQALGAGSPAETVDQIEAMLPRLRQPLSEKQLAALRLANTRQRALVEMARRVRNDPTPASERVPGP